jgi:hypothetical protein
MTPIGLDPVAREVAAALRNATISYSSVGNGRVRIPLPNEFGELEIGAIETIPNSVDSIVGLVGQPWHTHGDVLSAELGGNGHIDGIVRFVRAVFAGKYLLIEEQTVGQLPRKIILKDLDRYLKHLPIDATYRIYWPIAA